jgi:HK97 gp10 family phage protein
MDGSVKIEGLAELERNMNQLAEDVAKKHAVDAVKAGERILKDAIVASAQRTFQRRTGTLLANIRATVQIKGRGVRGAVVKAYVFLKSDAFYGRFWERGFRHVGRGKGNRARLRRGTIPGRPLRRAWMEPAFDAAAPRALDAVVARLRGFFGGGGGTPT